MSCCLDSKPPTAHALSSDRKGRGGEGTLRQPRRPTGASPDIGTSFVSAMDRCACVHIPTYPEERRAHKQDMASFASPYAARSVSYDTSTGVSPGGGGSADVHLAMPTPAPPQNASIHNAHEDPGRQSSSASPLRFTHHASYPRKPTQEFTEVCRAPFVIHRNPLQLVLSLPFPGLASFNVRSAVCRVIFWSSIPPAAPCVQCAETSTRVDRRAYMLASPPHQIRKRRRSLGDPQDGL